MTICPKDFPEGAKQAEETGVAAAVEHVADDTSGIRVELIALIYLLEAVEDPGGQTGISIPAARRKARDMLSRLDQNGTDRAAVARKIRYLSTAFLSNR